MNTSRDIKRIAVAALVWEAFSPARPTPPGHPRPPRARTQATCSPSRRQAPLPATWLELSKLDAQLSRDAEQAMSKVTSEVARISGYVSAATLNRDLGSIAKLTAIPKG
jgi:hypothetical protein